MNNLLYTYIALHTTNNVFVEHHHHAIFVDPFPRTKSQPETQKPCCDLADLAMAIMKPYWSVIIGYDCHSLSTRSLIG